MPEEKQSMLNIKDIGPRLKAEREKNPKITQTEAAALVSTPEREVSMRSWQEYEASRTSVPLDVLFRFAQVRGIPFADLLGVGDESTGEGVDVPIVDHIPAGALGQGFGEGGIMGYLQSMVKDPDAFALIVTGSSMSPEIQESDIVVCSPRAPFASGKIYAVVTSDGEQSLKRVRKDHRSKAYALIPSNKEFPTVYVPEEQIIKLVRVVEVRRDLQ